MEPTQLMKIAMPHREMDVRSGLNFFRSLSEALGSGKSRSDELAFRTLLLASITNGYVESSSQVTGISGQTVRNHLRDMKPDTLLRINRDMIATLRDTGVLDKPLMVALDWHDEMYYGNLETEGIIGTKNSRGTNYAYEYATASIVVKRLRFAVAVIPVKTRSILTMVRAVIRIMEELGIRIRMLLMDGGFFSADAIRFLVASGVPFIMHAPKLRKVCNDQEVDMKHTTSSHKRRKSEQAAFRMVSIYGRERSGKTVLYVFATNTSFPPASILRLFKKRWGIETGYRMIRKFLARTTSKRYSMRLLYFYLAILLYNFWVLMNLKGRMRIIADVMRTLTISILVTVNPYSTNLHLENRAYEGDF